MNNKPKNYFILLALATGVTSVFSQNNILTYQGRVRVDGTNFIGNGQFKFALVNAGLNIHRPATTSATVSGGRVTSAASSP